MSDFAKSFGPLRTLSWAVYLGCSWTWCIGMFLPVILVSEFGNTAWFVFAIPNVIGAAAMGWVLAKPGSSERIVAEHREVCVAFSAITLAFQTFFLYWLCYLQLIPWALAIAAIAIGITCGFLARWIKGLDHLTAWVVLGVSLAVMAKGLAQPVFGVAHPLNRVPISNAMSGLIVVCLFGFLLCPYLDLTFHRARQQTQPAAGKLAFGFGFGVIFLLMIILTLMYAGDIAQDRPEMYPDDRFGSFGIPLLVTWVVFHIAAQIGLKFTVHIRALPRPRPIDAIIWAVAGLLAGLTIFAVRKDQWFTVKQLGIRMYSGQLMYMLFMSFYGLIFPAYVWMFMVPIRGSVPQRNLRAMFIWIASVAIAAPMFWMGFVNLWMLWLIPGVLVVLAARFLAGATTANVQRSTFNGRRTSFFT